MLFRSQWDTHDKFFEIANKKNLYAKVVFDSKITDDELENVCNLAKKHNIELVLQPMMIGKTPSVESEFMQEILDSIGTIGDFTKSKLYQHMVLKTVDPDFSVGLKQELLKSFRDESFNYMQGNETWEKLKSGAL